LIDSHCHLDSRVFDEDRDEVIERAHQAGVTHIIVPSVNWQRMPNVIALSKAYSGIYAAVGIYPKYCQDWQANQMEQLHQLATKPEVVAIGEIGLDYNWRKKPPKERQITAFSKQLALAAELDLPVIIHNWQAEEDILRLVAVSPLAGRVHAGVMHGITANLEFAYRAIELGFYVGIGTRITPPNVKKLAKLVSELPLDRILLETDAPHLPPYQHRGMHNKPAYVRYVAEAVAKARDMHLNEIIAATTENTLRLFSKI